MVKIGSEWDGNSFKEENIKKITFQNHLLLFNISDEGCTRKYPSFYTNLQNSETFSQASQANFKSRFGGEIYVNVTWSFRTQ